MNKVFIHLHVHSNFSFKDSTLSVEDIISAAAACNMPAVALTDHDNLCGVIRFYYTACAQGVQPLIGVELTTTAGHLTLLALNYQGYSELCQLLSRMYLARQKACPLENVEKCTNIIVLSGCDRSELGQTIEQRGGAEVVRRYQEMFGDRYYLELSHHKLPNDNAKVAYLASLGQRLGVPVVATNNVHFAKPSDYGAYELLAAMRHNIRVDNHQYGAKLPNGEYHFKPTQAMERLFVDYPAALANTREIAERCQVHLPSVLRFPRFPLPEGESARGYLRQLCLEGVKRLYDQAAVPAALARLEYELAVIDTMGFNDYFLVLWDIVSFARHQGIRCAGRGSAADSIVSYLLGITHVDPLAYNLLFERFLNPQRKGMPDIDLDIDSNRRDQVLNYVYDRYGKNMVAMVATVNTMGARSAVREVAKAFGFSAEQQSAVSKRLPHCRADQIVDIIAALPELKGEFQERRYFNTIFAYAARFADFPRHLGIHNGGVVLADAPLDQLTPLQYAAKGIVICQHDKDDIERLGLVKMDLLGLKMLSIITDTVECLAKRGVKLDIDKVSPDDPTAYALLRSTKTIGLFQLESPGMRELLGRLQPTRFEDIIATISLFRPGPMQGDMIAPYINRRHGREKVDYLHPRLEPALKDTYGVIVYQEQILQIGHLLAGFTLGQADLLRRAMTKDRSAAEMSGLREQFIQGCLNNGVDQDVAETVFNKVAGFAAYGFNKAHAASFGWIAYQSAYLKAHHAPEFLCATLNNYPCGFYPPWVIIWEAKRLGITVLPPLLDGPWDCTAAGNIIRLGLKYVRGVVRRQWECRNFSDDIVRRVRAIAPSNALTVGDRIKQEIAALGMAITYHPLKLFNVGYIASSDVEEFADGTKVAVAGLVVIRQTPPTRSGKRIIFLTLQDEAGLIDVTVFPNIQDKYAKTVYRATMLRVTGIVRKTGAAGFSIIAQEIEAVC